MTERIGLSRRGFLGAGALGAGALVAGSTLAACGDDTTPAAATIAAPVPFRGAKQAGIATPSQDRLVFATFDITSKNVDDVKTMLKAWTEAAEAMTQGQDVAGSGEEAPLLPPADTGEAMGLAASQLTITIGFGPSMFDKRFGLASKRPAALAEIPALPGDVLRPELCGGDIAIQACANDPQVAFHAVRNLARLGRGTVVMRWSQLGFGRTSSTSASQATPRNLMGFKDGTRNIHGEDEKTMNEQVWVGAEGDQQWMAGGTYMVSRRIRMLIESWDRGSLAEQERVIGRFKRSGAPLTSPNKDSAEFDDPDYAAKTDGNLTIDTDAHIRLASPENNDNLHLLRRGYSYTDGMDYTTGQLDAGLFFIAFQKDPRKQFVPLQRRLGSIDALTEYIKHTGSGVFAVPAGVSDGEYWGQSLFA